MSQRTASVALAAAVFLGAVSWWVVAQVTGRREAWDSEMYFIIVLPALGLVSAALGFLVPHRPWRWALAPFAGQALRRSCRIPPPICCQLD